MATRTVVINENVTAIVVVDDYEVINALPTDQIRVMVKELIVTRDALENW